MKFTDGYWHVREGVTIHNPVELRDVKADAGSLVAYAACKMVKHRGDTLNAPLITIEYSSPLAEVIGVRIWHHRGRKQLGPEFALHREDVAIKITDEPARATLQSGKLQVTVGKGEGWKVDFRYDGRRLTGTGTKSTGYILDAERGAYIREQLDLGVGEYVYGLGERFTPFVKNGQVVDIWNEDGGTSSEQAYKNIPFYITNQGYGVLVNHPERVSFEIASENVSKVQFSVPGEYLEYYIIGGASLKEVLQNYTKLTGRPALPPAWSFGLWLTTSFTTSYDEATVNSFIDGMIERDLPLHVFHFDCFWMKEYQWCDFRWDPEVFPEPETMLQRLKAKGLKICVWINPYIAQKSYLFDEGMKHGYLVKTKNGDVWQWDRWQAGMGLVDFTNPAATRWFQGKLKALLDMGVDCFKTDFGERIPTDVVYYDGSDPLKMHNYYTFLYNKAVFELLEAVRGKHEAALFARSATVGGQQFPVHWGGDCSATYESMAETLRGGLSLCLTGFGFWSHDISGFEKTAPPDIYKRWIAFGLLSSHSRLHGNESYRVPWLFDEESVEVLRFFTHLKCSLMPYLFGAAVNATQTGVPMLRAMVLEFAADPTCSFLDRQYMLGDSLLVAPIFNTEGQASYYLPAGTWTHFLTGEKIQGGCWREERHDYLSLPLLARQNSIIAVGNNLRQPAYDYADGVTLHLFELADGASAATIVYNTDGAAELTVTAERRDGKVTVVVEGSGKPWSLLLRGVNAVHSVSGGSSQKEPLGIKITPEPGNGRLIVAY
ncbi:alpha-D-xyloside xylohydrolase [Hydrogenispora ethanolica]|uniref:alpha-D-xyloside xylohydrolase n=1 Tax=Hydrogenispora ethanolica TaxID=1082276 RepID=A0A4R1R8D6_HYDET|nr:alpha-xylosidase [Hydrogenispora ethanolica]TCL61921.1 alpha-D-xyloside xylohydrolase [Hydrogenispora ethanolica]